jgi:hypothetical protein
MVRDRPNAVNDRIRPEELWGQLGLGHVADGASHALVEAERHPVTDGDLHLAVDFVMSSLNQCLSL